VVESQLPKLLVAGSIPVSRSIQFPQFTETQFARLVEAVAEQSERQAALMRQYSQPARAALLAHLAGELPNLLICQAHTMLQSNAESARRLGAESLDQSSKRDVLSSVGGLLALDIPVRPGTIRLIRSRKSAMARRGKRATDVSLTYRDFHPEAVCQLGVASNPVLCSRRPAPATGRRCLAPQVPGCQTPARQLRVGAARTERP
jgi:hypothetical protein